VKKAGISLSQVLEHLAYLNCDIENIENCLQCMSTSLSEILAVAGKFAAVRVDSDHISFFE